MRKIFNLSIETETIEALRKLAATRQLETGEKISVTSIINEAVSVYFKNSGFSQGDENNELQSL